MERVGGRRAGDEASPSRDRILGLWLTLNPFKKIRKVNNLQKQFNTSLTSKFFSEQFEEKIKLYKQQYYKKMIKIYNVYFINK